jgi:hypothetical protein
LCIRYIWEGIWEVIGRWFRRDRRIHMASSLHMDPPIPPEPPPNDLPDTLPDVSDAQLLAWIQRVDSHKFTSPISLPNIKNHHIQLQTNGGANHLITNLKLIFTVYWDIDPLHINGIGEGFTCTSKGIFPLICDDGSTILISMYYLANATCTVISPTNMVCNHNDIDSWWQVCNIKQGTGSLCFYSSTGFTQFQVLGAVSL